MATRRKYLKSLDTFGHCPVFSLGVSQHLHNITERWNFLLNWSSKLQERNERKKHPCFTIFVWFQMNNKLFIIWVRNYLKNYITSEGAVSHNVLYYQQLSIAHYQVNLDANIYFEYLLIKSSAFKQLNEIGPCCDTLYTKPKMYHSFTVPPLLFLAQLLPSWTSLKPIQSPTAPTTTAL